MKGWGCETGQAWVRAHNYQFSYRITHPLVCLTTSLSIASRLRQPEASVRKSVSQLQSTHQ
jgi:hypothetical protein